VWEHSNLRVQAIRLVVHKKEHVGFPASGLACKVLLWFLRINIQWVINKTCKLYLLRNKLNEAICHCSSQHSKQDNRKNLLLGINQGEVQATHQVGPQKEQLEVYLSQICSAYHEQCHHTLQDSVKLRVWYPLFPYIRRRNTFQA
jgi:hypothetical protein